MTSGGKLLVDHVIPASKDGGGAAFEMKKGQVIRIIGKATVDFVAFNLHNLKERFDQARTKTAQMKIFVTKADVLFSKDNSVMMTIVEDTWPWHHDLQKGMCSRKQFEMIFRGDPVLKFNGRGDPIIDQDGHQTPTYERWEDVPLRGCWENLTEALKPWPIDPWDIPSPINIFGAQSMRIDGETGRMWNDPKIPEPKEDGVVELRAEMDLLVAASHHRGVTTHIQIYEE